MKIPMVDLKAQYKALKPEVDEAITRVLESAQFILGPEVQAFEKEVAAWCNVKHAIGLASGTDALLVALRASGVRPGDEVITTAFSFIATSDTITSLGAIPVFVDIDPHTYNVDPNQLETNISNRTRAILPVHLYGQSAHMDPILALAKKYNLKVIEDNAQAIGAKYMGRATGTLGDIGCLSFYPSKNLGAYGDGGMALTNDDDLAERVYRLRAHGGSNKYLSQEQGYNSRLVEV